MRNVRFSVLFILLLSLFSCHKAEEKKKVVSYEDMMGRQLDCWQYVMAPVDFSNLAFFKEIFEKNASAETAHSDSTIPRVLHFIWIGPKNFPRESIPNIQSWIDNHPGWKVKFWTDRKRFLPHEALEECIIKEWQYPALEQCYHKSDNFAEKADLLRYQILLQEGGVYVDHDVKCFKSFEDFNKKYELYCGLELPSDTPISSSIHATNNLIASRPGHPILQRCVAWLPEHWDEIEALYPGKDKQSVIRRIGNRTFAAFADSVRDLAGKTTHDMVFPAYYFNAPTDEDAVYARHLYTGTWFQTENAFEKMARQRLMLLSKKVNKILLFCAVATGINLLGIGLLFFTIKRKASVR